MDRQINQRQDEIVDRLRVNLERNDHADHDENDHVGHEGGELPKLVHEMLHLRADPCTAHPRPDQAQRHQAQHAGDGEEMFARIKNEVCRHQHHRCFHQRIVEHPLDPRHADETHHDAQRRAAQADDKKSRDGASHREHAGPGHRADEHDKRHDGRAVVEQRFALDKRAQFFTRAKFLEQRDHGDGIGRAHHGPE